MDIHNIRSTINLLDSGLSSAISSAPLHSEQASAILYFHMRKIELLSDLIKMVKNEQLSAKYHIIEKSLVADVQLLTSRHMNSGSNEKQIIET